MRSIRINTIGEALGDSLEMYVCVCNAIRECDLRKAAKHVAGDAESVYAALGKRPNCGQCLEEAEDVLFEERELALPPAFAA